MKADVLSRAIGSLIGGLETQLNANGNVDGRTARAVIGNLVVMRKMAKSMEQELAVHRLGEANTIGRGHAEQLSTEALTHLVLDPEGKVVKPDFGRKG